MRKSVWWVVTIGLFVFQINLFAAHNVPSDAFTSAGPEAIPQLIEAAESEDPADMDLKVKAIQRLGELKSKEALPVILSSLGYGSETIIRQGGGKKYYTWQVRVVAAKALAEIGDARAVNSLAKRVLKDEEVTVRRASVQALGLMGEKARTKDVLLFLYSVLEKTPDNALASDICDALGKIGDKSSFVPLLRVTQGNYLNYVKDLAQKAIAKINWNQPSVFDEKQDVSASGSKDKKSETKASSY